MILGVTGHRPNKLGGYSPAAQDRMHRFAVFVISSYKPSTVIIGLALGWDTAVAKACIDLRVPFIAAVPFEGQETLWPAESRHEYYRVIAHAAKVVYVSPPGFSASKMQIRNEWIVDNCTHLAALHDGSSGGTNNCVKYAKSVKKPTVNLWDSWTTFN
jgi:uncharacterized phage-like protein YoqJ